MIQIKTILLYKTKTLYCKVFLILAHDTSDSQSG